MHVATAANEFVFTALGLKVKSAAQVRCWLFWLTGLVPLASLNRLNRHKRVQSVRWSAVCERENVLSSLLVAWWSYKVVKRSTEKLVSVLIWRSLAREYFAVSWCWALSWQKRNSKKWHYSHIHCLIRKRFVCPFLTYTYYNITSLFWFLVNL